MTEETLEKAGKLKKDINEIRDNIYCLRCRKRNAKEVPSYGGYYRWKWLMRFKKDDKEKAVVFDNDNIGGTEIVVDEELLDLIISYFENKLLTKEKEFQELN